VLASDLAPDQLQQAARPTADATSAALEDLSPEQRAAFARLIKTHISGTE
jgi:hypothetical protein